MQQHLTAGLPHAIGEPQVDLGLAAAGDAVQQRHAEIARIDKRGELLERRRLLRREHARSSEG